MLVKTGLQEPRGLAVHPFRGWLFYTDWGDNAHIGRLGMDGTRHEEVVPPHGFMHTHAHTHTHTPLHKHTGG